MHYYDPDNDSLNKYKQQRQDDEQEQRRHKRHQELMERWPPGWWEKVDKRSRYT